MIELLSTSDSVRLSFLRAALDAEGVDTVVFDAGAPWPGAIPSRLMVAERDASRARWIIYQSERSVSPSPASPDRDAGDGAR